MCSQVDYLTFDRNDRPLSPRCQEMPLMEFQLSLLRRWVAARPDHAVGRHRAVWLGKGVDRQQ